VTEQSVGAANYIAQLGLKVKFKVISRRQMWVSNAPNTRV